MSIAMCGVRTGGPGGTLPPSPQKPGHIYVHVYVTFCIYNHIMESKEYESMYNILMYILYYHL